MSRIVRLQIEIDQDQMKELERLQKLGGLRTKKDLFNNALTLLKWAARERGRGASIVSVDEKARLHKELEMPFLEDVANATLKISVADSAPARDEVAVADAGDIQAREKKTGAR